MPELPEVETMCRGIAPIVGRVVRRVERVRCRCRPIAIEPRIDRFAKRACGQKVVDVKRAGKRVVIWLADSSNDIRSSGASPGAQAIVLEPRMTGLVLLADPPSAKHLRFRMRLGGSPPRELLFWDRRGLGSVRLFTAAEFARRFGEHGLTLGPDALELTAEQLRKRLERSRRAIKVALLDQRAVAGVGNLYASELLHLAGVHPRSPCEQLTPTQWRRIHAAMRDVLQAAIRYEGSTLSDGTYRNALNEAGGYQNHHRVYDRAGQKCPTCEESIVRMVQAQRSTFFCPKCQRSPGRPPAARQLAASPPMVESKSFTNRQKQFAAHRRVGSNEESAKHSDKAKFPALNVPALNASEK